MPIAQANLDTLPQRPEMNGLQTSRLFAAVAAASLPALIAFNLPPSATFFNQAAALVGWGLFAMTVAMLIRSTERVVGVPSNTSTPALKVPSGLAAMIAALVIVMASAAVSSRFGTFPPSLALSSIGMILAAMVLIWAGAAARGAGALETVFHAFCMAWVVAGLLCVAIALIEVFMPELADGTLIARSEAGRAAGNLRQPNHLGSLVVWSTIAAIWLYEAGLIKRWAAIFSVTAFVFTVTMSASRTGLVEVIALAAWGLLDRRLSRTARALLVLSPLIYFLGWLCLAAWASVGSQTFFGAEKLKQADMTGSRFAIWSDALQLIKSTPWLGTGFGEFNFAWTLTVLPQRPVEFFDHPHNLLLHLAAELGLPLAGIVISLLCWALWRAFSASRRGSPDQARATRAAFVMLFTIAIHSQLEYPLWYAYFLLPTALLFGLCIGPEPRTGIGDRATQRSGDQAGAAPVAHASNARAPGVSSAFPEPRPRTNLATAALFVAGALVAASTLYALIDYRRVVVIFAPAEGAAPLADRIAEGQRSWFFGYHADYAAVTSQDTPLGDASAWNGALHYLLDTRLMMSWAEALARSGDIERARYVAARLREFRNPDSLALFEACTPLPAASSAPSRSSSARAKVTLDPSPPYQCVPPASAFTYRDFIKTAPPGAH